MTHSHLPQYEVRVVSVQEQSDLLIEGILGVLGQFDKETLAMIADERDRIHPHGWSQRMIREYLDVWGRSA